MQYKENKIYTTSQGIEPLTALLLSNGIDSVAVEDSKDIKELYKEKNNNDWDFVESSLITDDGEAILTFYTEDDETGLELLENLKIEIMKLKSDEMYRRFGENTDFGRMYMESQPLSDSWRSKWKKGLRPFNVTKNIVIKPTWEDYNQSYDKCVIEIDPGMAFGTGSHETTRSCIILIEKYLDAGDTVLDIGSGTGILSMAAIACGAAYAHAYEIDPVAVRVSESNILTNGLGNKITLVNHDFLETEIVNKYDLIVSNLTSGIIRKILPVLKKVLDDGGKLILSGMLEEEKKTMNKYFAEVGYSFEDEIIEGEWYTVLLTLQR